MDLIIAAVKQRQESHLLGGKGEDSGKKQGNCQRAMMYGSVPFRVAWKPYS